MKVQRAVWRPPMCRGKSMAIRTARLAALCLLLATQAAAGGAHSALLSRERGGCPCYALCCYDTLLLLQFPCAGAARPSPRPPQNRRPLLPPPAPQPPPRARHPRPPPSPPQAPASLAEAGWLLWVRHLHRRIQFGTPPVWEGSTQVAKLLPKSYWYSLLARDDVPAGAAAADVVGD